MEFSQVVRRRRMTRGFDADRPVPHHILQSALEQATRAPSAGFSQGWDFVVLRGEQTQKFWPATTSEDRPADRWLTGVSAAPCLIVCVSNPDAYLDRYAEPDKGWADRDTQRWPIPYWDVDTGMAALLVLLTATDHDLGGLFFGVPAHAMTEVKEVLKIPQGRRLVGVVALGYPLADRKSPSLRRGRRRLETVAHDGEFGQPWSGG
ncbi:nitroreductase family protein [Ornithinimicrobium sp. Arc0846-15]|nr:nitroreductase family protein [Ornithinimicrobium laminariae]